MINPLGDALGGRPSTPASRGKEPLQALNDIRQYISTDWDSLTRSLTKCEAFEDVKISGKPILYLPVEVAIPPDLIELQKHCSLRIEHLPTKVIGSGEKEVAEIHSHGLLYLENPYVVPGGQFNEMYGWDSYFIIRGLLRDGRRDLARGMVENFFYEIQHYGGVLNANRTYYLGRSQPPFLSSMILAVYDGDKADGEPDLEWLKKAYGFAVSDYEQWNHEPHLAGDTGLSRYFDEGEGPVPEIMGDPSNYYREALNFFLLHEGKNSPHLVRVDTEHPPASVVGPVFEVPACVSGTTQTPDSNCTSTDRIALSSNFYKGDRGMRESGFDVSFRFGPFGEGTHHYVPVCLNSLLYKTEKDLQEMSHLLGREEEARRWENKALERQKRMTQYLWDERRGLFFDYNFMSHERSSYEYATTFYPLWAGLALKEQARAVAANLALFEQVGGLAMSRFESGAQWDYPYGWAPIQLLAVEGLRRYGFGADADRVTYKFLTMVLGNFRRDHTLREKYNVVTRSAETHIEAGYTQNVAGFGWTNGVFLEMLHESPPELIARLQKE
jgi:alpha,alpha-trehalase